YEPVNRDNVLEGAKLAFGQPVETRYDFSKADVILLLDADFLSAGFPGSTKYIRDFAKRRNPDAGEMSRLYVVESGMSATGAKADHRIPRSAGVIEEFVKAIAPLIEGAQDLAGNIDDQAVRFALKIAAELKSHAGSSLVIAGDQQSPIVHALVH